MNKIQVQVIVAGVLLAAGFLSLPIKAHGLESYESIMQEALKLRSEKKITEAAELYTSIITENKGDVDALVGRGFCYLQSEDLMNEAENDFKQVISLTPDYLDAYYGLALFNKRSGEWQQAREVLETAKINMSDEQKQREYLAEIAWRIGDVQLARSMEDVPPSEQVERVKGYRNEFFVDYIHDWVEDRPDWHQANLTYIHHPRPDLYSGISFSAYERNEENDFQIGISAGYRYSMNINLEYQGYFSTEQEFLAIQKHHATFYYLAPSSTNLGLGVRLDEYDNGWAQLGTFEISQYIQSCYGSYTLYIGSDNFDRSVATHIFKLGYEGEQFFSHIGYSNGDETLDLGGGSNFSDQLVESVFLNLRYFITSHWGVAMAGGGEYRDSELFRTTGSLSLVYRF